MADLNRSEPDKEFFDALKWAAERLRADGDAWAEFVAEANAWDVALMDGLDHVEEFDSIESFDRVSTRN